MKKLLFAFLLLFLFCTCKKDPYANLCGGSDPIKNLAWLKVRIDTLQKTNHNIVQRGFYQNRTIFSESSNNPAYNSVILYFDCDGKKVNLTADQYNQLLFDGLPKKQVIWQN